MDMLNWAIYISFIKRIKVVSKEHIQTIIISIINTSYFKEYELAISSNKKVFLSFKQEDIFNKLLFIQYLKEYLQTLLPQQLDIKSHSSFQSPLVTSYQEQTNEYLPWVIIRFVTKEFIINTTIKLEQVVMVSNFIQLVNSFSLLITTSQFITSFDFKSKAIIIVTNTTNLLASILMVFITSTRLNYQNN